MCSVFITCAVADSLIFDNVVALKNAENLDLLLEVLQGRLLVGLQLFHSNQLTRVIAQRIITAKFNTAKVSLKKVSSDLVCADIELHTWTV